MKIIVVIIIIITSLGEEINKDVQNPLFRNATLFIVDDVVSVQGVSSVLFVQDRNRWNTYLFIM